MLPLLNRSGYIQNKVELNMKNLVSGLLVVSLAFLVGCAAGTNPAVGAWNIEMNTPLGAMPAVLTINADGTGNMSADGLGEAPLSGILVDGDAVNFSAEVDAQGQTLVLEFTGTVAGDAITGEFGSDFGAFGVTGTRQ